MILDLELHIYIQLYTKEATIYFLMNEYLIFSRVNEFTNVTNKITLIQVNPYE